MAKSMGRTIANVLILSAITLTCAATAIGVYAMNRNAEVDPGSSSIGGGTKDPRSITKIEKTNTLGLIDEYTITYTDNTTSTFFVTNGKDGTEGIQGLPGADGHTPTITVGTNGNWVVDGVDLGIRAEGLRGPQGEAGRGIVSVTKTNTSGQIDEYTITYTDNTTSTFVVTNGTNGEQGIQGLPGADGHTPTIEIGTNGNWFIDNVDSGVAARGPAGQNGKSAYEIAVDNGYPGTETEWLLSLIGAAGAVGPSGANGKSAYEIAVDNGYPGTEAEWLESLIGQNGNNGMSAYQLYCEGHIDPDLSEPDWIASLYGKSAYDIYCSVNPDPDMSESDWLASLVGADGSDGRGIASITGPVESGSYDTYTINYTDGSTPTQFIVRHGTNGNDGASLLTGADDPLPTTGNNGDSYINTTTWEYFTKNGNTWTSKGSIRGTDGSNGSNGIDGTDGKTLLTGDGVPSAAANAGDSYIDLSSCDYYIYNGTSWDLVANIKGETGKGITTIALTDSSEANRDQYTITYSDGTSFSYYVAKPRSILSIAKTSTSDLVDTYTITYSYGETSTFTVTNGEDGRTIYHGETAPDDAIGNQNDVYIDTHNLNMYFKGISSWGTPISFKGTDGVGISTIAKTGTVDLVDTYTITYTDGNTFDFTVTNGADGKDGTKVVTGTSQPTSTVGYQLGDSYIDTTTWKYYVLIENPSEELVWEYRGTIKGDDGTDGQDGTKFRVGDTAPTETTGYQEGDSYLDTSTWDFYVLTKDGEGNLNWGSAVGNIHNSPNVLTVTFESNGGTAVAAIDDALEGERITKPADPTKDGYFFEGWYTSEGNKWAFEKDVVTEDITLLARWGQIRVENGVLKECTLTGDVKIPYVYNGEMIESFDSDVFSNRNDITSLDLPATISSIPSLAFENCSALTKVTLHSGLVEIGDNAFSSLSSLRTVTLPETLETIGEEAFSGTGLTSAVLPSSLESMGEGAFDGCGSLRYVTFQRESAINEIPSNAFTDCAQLKSIILPDGLTNIGESSFSGCSSLENIALPESLLQVGASAFASCTSLRRVIVADGFAGQFGENVFSGCSGLKEMELPFIGFGDSGTSGLSYLIGSASCTLDKLTVTGDSPIKVSSFSGCTIKELVFSGNPSEFASGCLTGIVGLESLTVPYVGSNATTPTHFGYLFGAASYSSQRTAVVSTLKTVHITNATSIADNALYKLYITNVSLPDTLTSIGENAFKDSRIESIVIPDSVTSIGANAFQNCQYLVYATLPNNSSYKIIGDNMFRTCVSLKAIVIPDQITEIGSYAFNYCTNLSSVALPSDLKTIKSYAFETCKALTSISFPGSLETIGERAFSQDTNLHDVNGLGVANYNVTKRTIGNYAFFKTGIRSLKMELKNSQTIEIGNSAFNQCSELYYVCLWGKNDSTLGTGAFSQCYGLTSLELRGFSNINRDSFSNCTSLVSVAIDMDIRSSDVTINDSAFYNCYSLTQVSSACGTLSILNGAFEICVQLRRIGYPKSAYGLSGNNKIQVIGDSAFKNCSSLEEIDLRYVTEIGQSAFESCFALKSVTIPDTITTLSQGAFIGCTSLENVYLPSSVTNISSNVFSGAKIKTLTIVYNSSESYSIEDGAFYNCTIETINFTGTSAQYQAIISSAGFENTSHHNDVLLPTNPDVTFHYNYVEA